jgi:hypothetical protein
MLPAPEGNLSSTSQQGAVTQAAKVASFAAVTELVSEKAPEATFSNELV